MRDERRGGTHSSTTFSQSHPGQTPRWFRMMAQSTDTQKGWMPEATRIGVPSSNFAPGNNGRKAAVIHIVEGAAGSALSEFTRASAQKSSHFVVGKDGRIWQCVSVIDSAYANGLSWSNTQRCWVDPEKNVLKAPNPTPAWTGLIPPINPNMYTISIEREGHYQDVPPGAQNAAVVRILQYIHATFPALIPSWVFMTSLIGHCHIAPKHRANCPGPHVDFAALAAAANGVYNPARYRVRKIMISQRQTGGPPYAGELQPGEVVEIDVIYSNNLCHLKSGLGFVPIADLEPAGEG